MRYYESKREQEGLYLLLARPDVVDIWDQPPPVFYHDANGRKRSHTFDFLITLSSGKRIAIAVKPDALRAGLEEAAGRGGGRLVVARSSSHSGRS